MKKLLFFLPALFLCVTAHAASITVTTTDDELNSDGDCSLREAIQAANTNAAVDACAAGTGGDVIYLEGKTYTLSLAGSGENLNATGDLDILDAVTIIGTHPQFTIIDANGIDRVFDFRIGSIIALSMVTVKNGIAPLAQDGGGIEMVSGGSGLLNHCIVENNTTSGGGGSAGGGVSVAGGSTLDISYSSLIGNTSSGYGGGVSYFGSSSGAITNSTISGNTSQAAYGGGVEVATALVNIRNSTITNNHATGTSDGGGLALTAPGTIVNLTDSIVASNTDSGGQAPDCTIAAGAIFTGYSLISNNTGCVLPADPTSQIGTNLNPIDPRLNALSYYYGGTTPLHTLQASSPAIDSANPLFAGSGGTCETFDQTYIVQRGYDGNGDSVNGCDMGAAEYVVLETQTFSSRRKLDGFVVESGEDTASGGRAKANGKIRVGDTAQNRQVKGFLSFKTAGLPDTAVPLNATLSISPLRIRGSSDPFVSHGPLFTEIKNGFFGSSRRLETVDFESVNSNLNAIPFVSNGVVYYSYLDHNSLVSISLTGLTQFRLAYALDDNNDLSSNAYIFQSGEGASNKPELVVYYYVP